MEEIKKLPEELVRYIFSYIIGDITKIEFIDYDFLTFANTNYHPRYKVAIGEDGKKIFNKEGRFLSRIEKIGKNLIPKYRYYFTDETIVKICCGCGKENCRSRGCRGSHTYEYIYQSAYVGKLRLWRPCDHIFNEELFIIILNINLDLCTFIPLKF